jgi:ATP-dependent RNA helicase DeaD
VSGAFEALGLDPRLLAALATLGYEEATPIQCETIPALLAGRDVLGQAATGTGKTAAFALPILQRLLGGDAPPARKARTARALVLVPTRELAMQVAEAVHRYGKALGVRATPIYGGQPIDRQIKVLRAGVDLVVATPGRALDHLRRKSLGFDAVEIVVLDEADEMLDMGFAEDLEAILAETPAARQTALFSATIPPRIAQIAAKHLRDPLRVAIAREPARAGTMPRVRQMAYVVARPHKVATLVRLLDVEQPKMALVFCRTRVDVDALTEALNARGFAAEPLHGGMSQEQRDRVMRRFRAGTTELLIATDVAARGLDLTGLSHVVNYDVPSASDDYVHRIGRTGRAGREGVAITLVEPREHRLIRNIEHATRQKIQMGTIPTVADLRTRKLEMTTAGLRETLIGGELERFRVVVDALSSEFDIVDIALGAVKLAHQASGGEHDEEEIPAPPPPPRHTKDGKAARPAKPGKPPLTGGSKGKGAGKRTPNGTARLFVGAGRNQGIRPADLVGAIANETGLPGRAIGAIEITDRFSVVELPEDVVDEVVDRMKGSLVKGKKVVIRRDRA